MSQKWIEEISISISEARPLSISVALGLLNLWQNLKLKLRQKSKIQILKKLNFWHNLNQSFGKSNWTPQQPLPKDQNVDEDDYWDGNDHDDVSVTWLEAIW